MVQPSKELIIFHSLKGRTNFSKNEQQIYQNEKKGYEGEIQFSRLLNKKLHHNHLRLDGLMLEHNGTICQLDMILIFQQQLYLFEVKNYYGEFQLERDHLHCYTTKKNYRNPLHQLQRSELIIHDLLVNMGANFQINSFVVFINPNFTLYHATRGHPIILPTQIHDFIKGLNNITGTISEQHRRLTQKLCTLHMEDSPFVRYPTYQFNHLRKGIFCKKCRGLMKVSKFYFHCLACGYKEGKDAGVLRHVAEFSILFPEQKILSGIVHDWLDKKISRGTIHNVLASYMNQIQNNRYTYYDFKK